MIREAIATVVARKNLTRNQTIEVFGEIMSGKATPAQIASFITALRMKGETVEEIAGAVTVMRSRCQRIGLGERVVVDTCGTGGSGSHKFNISTIAAFVVAGCGLAVAKHGNRSASGRCGSADVLEALGILIDGNPAFVKTCVEKIGVGFIFAPVFHAAMKHAVAPRREIGIRTIFNSIGPLSNPAGVRHQVVGVADPALTGIIARVLKSLGVQRAFVVHGMDGLDEITTTTKSRIFEVHDRRLRSFVFDPTKYGIKRARPSALRGGDAGTNARIFLSVLKGARGPRRDIVLLNAAAALLAGGKASDFREGIAQAEASIDTGRALEKFEKLVSLSREYRSKQPHNTQRK